MAVSKQINQEVASLLQQGFSPDSIIKVMMKKDKNLKLTKADLLIIAKKNNIKNVGNRDLSKVKMDKDMMSKALPMMLNDKGIMKQVISKLILILVFLLILIGVIWYFGSGKAALITLGVVLALVIIGCLIAYIKFVKPNKQIRESIKKNLKS